MKKFLLILCFLMTTTSFAQLKDLFKNIEPKKNNSKGNQTEQIIGSGLGLIKALQPIGYKEEMAIGGAVALEAVARFGGLWENPAVEKYLSTVGKAVALTSDRPDIPYYFAVLNTEEPNAFACPGGYIFVSRGLLKLVQNEAQLAGVLGHEIGHVAKRHALEAIRSSKVLSSVSEVTLSALDKDPKMFDSVVKETVSMILDRGLGSSKELEADAIGTNFAFRVGYNPSGLSEFLKELDHVSKNQKGGVFKTHPKTSTRIARISQELAKSEYQGSQTFPLLADRLKNSFTGTF